MPIKLTYNDLQILVGVAKRNYIEHPPCDRLPGMNRDLNGDELRVLSIYEATIQMLNHKGCFSTATLDLLKTQFERADSDPEAEYQDWSEEEAKKP